MESKKAELSETESRMVATRGWGVRNWGDVGQWVQNLLLEVEYDLQHSILIIINNTVLYTLKLLRDYILNVLITKKK